MDDIPEELHKEIELRTVDIAIGGQKLDQLASLKGGGFLAYKARKEVRKLECEGLPTIKALYEVFKLVATDKL